MIETQVTVSLYIRLKKIQEKKKIIREKAEREKKAKGVKAGKITQHQHSPF